MAGSGAGVGIAEPACVGSVRYMSEIGVAPADALCRSA